MKNKKNILPKYWVVKCDGSQLYRDTVIKYLNELAQDAMGQDFVNHPKYCRDECRLDYWHGKDLNQYYGYDGNTVYFGGGNTYTNLSKFFNDPTVLTLEQFIEMTKEASSELEDLKNMNELKITRTQLKKIHDIACASWKCKILNLGARNPLEENVFLTQLEIDEMFADATKEQLPILESIFGKQVEEIDLRTGKIDGRELFNNFGEYTDKGTYNNAIMGIRTASEYANKAIFLHKSYQWEIIKDREGCLCLVPTRKIIYIPFKER